MVLPPNTEADARARKRLLKEAQTALQLNHPSIATIYEVNQSDHVPATDLQAAGEIPIPNPNAIQEFKLRSSLYNADASLESMKLTNQISS